MRQAEDACIEELPQSQLEWMAKAEEEIELIESMAVVRSVQLVYNKESTNANKAKATVSCCRDEKGLRFKQLTVSCDEATKTTHLEALQELRRVITEKHMCEGHERHPKAAARLEREGERALQRGAAPAAADAPAPPAPVPPPANLFDQLMAGQAVVGIGARKAMEDERMLEKARIAERAASDAVEKLRVEERAAADALEAAERRARESRAAHERLKLPVAARKRQKQIGEPSSSAAWATQDEGAEARQPETEPEGLEPDPALWESYTLTDFKRLRRLFERTNSVHVEETEAGQMGAAAVKQLRQRKGSRFGWREPGAYGVLRILRHWAAGSRSCISLMLAEAAKILACKPWLWSSFARRIGGRQRQTPILPIGLRQHCIR
jgi:hypothetical protein